MPTYVQAVTTQNDQLFLRCGTSEVAGNQASNGSEGSGSDFSLVLASSFKVIQPYDQAASSYNTAQCVHELNIAVPNYQPIQSMVLNIMNERKTIAELFLNYVAIKPGGQKRQLIGQYAFTNGILTAYDAEPSGNGEKSIGLTFVFEKVVHTNYATDTSGFLTVTDMGAA